MEIHSSHVGINKSENTEQGYEKSNNNSICIAPYSLKIQRRWKDTEALSGFAHGGSILEEMGIIKIILQK